MCVSVARTDATLHRAPALWQGGSVRECEGGGVGRKTREVRVGEWGGEAMDVRGEAVRCEGK